MAHPFVVHAVGKALVMRRDRCMLMQLLYSFQAHARYDPRVMRGQNAAIPCDFACGFRMSPRKSGTGFVMVFEMMQAPLELQGSGGRAPIAALFCQVPKLFARILMKQLQPFAPHATANPRGADMPLPFAEAGCVHGGSQTLCAWRLSDVVCMEALRRCVHGGSQTLCAWRLSDVMCMEALRRCVHGGSQTLCAWRLSDI
jgi:hypothetical protein